MVVGDGQHIARSGDTINVLIIEDHAMVADALASSIASEPDMAVVGTAGTIEDGLNLAGQYQPRVALVDYRLPDGNGAGATVALKAASPQTDVIMMTAMSGQDVLARAIESGCSGFLRKTEPIENVVQSVRATSRGETWFASEVLSDLVGNLRSPKPTVGRDLTPREHEVLRLLAQGMSTDQIVEELVVSPHTARNHIRNILGKLGAHSKLEAVAIAAREHIINFDNIE